MKRKENDFVGKTIPETNTLKAIRQFCNVYGVNYECCNVGQFDEIKKGLEKGSKKYENKVFLFYQLLTSTLTNIYRVNIELDELPIQAQAAWTNNTYWGNNLKNDFTLLTKKYGKIVSLTFETNGGQHDDDFYGKEKFSKQVLNDYVKEKMIKNADYYFYAITKAEKKNVMDQYKEIAPQLKEFLGIYA